MALFTPSVRILVLTVHSAKAFGLADAEAELKKLKNFIIISQRVSFLGLWPSRQLSGLPPWRAPG